MGIVDNYGMHGFMWFFAICSLFTTLVIYVFLPETKGKRIDSIADLFNNPKN